MSIFSRKRGWRGPSAASEVAWGDFERGSRASHKDPWIVAWVCQRALCAGSPPSHQPKAPSRTSRPLTRRISPQPCSSKMCFAALRIWAYRGTHRHPAVTRRELPRCCELEEVCGESGLRLHRPQRERRLISRRLLESAQSRVRWGSIRASPARKGPLRGQRNELSERGRFCTSKLACAPQATATPRCDLTPDRCEVRCKPTSWWAGRGNAPGRRRSAPGASLQRGPPWVVGRRAGKKRFPKRRESPPQRAQVASPEAD